MVMALDSSILSPSRFVYGSKSLSFLHHNRHMKLPMKSLQDSNRYPFRLASNCVRSCGFGSFLGSTYQRNNVFVGRASLRSINKHSENLDGKNGHLALNFELVGDLVKHGIVLAAMVCGVLIYGCKRAFAVEGVFNAGDGVVGQSILLLRKFFFLVLKGWNKLLHLGWGHI